MENFQFGVGIAMMWILFLALFPMSFFWLRRAYRIFVKKDYSEVALKRGEGPPNPKKYAPYTGTVNLLAGLFMVYTILAVFVYVATGVMILPITPEEMMKEVFWLKFAGSTVCMKVIFDYIVSRQAHPFVLKKRKKKAK